MEENTVTSKIEFNSMGSILERLSKITYDINGYKSAGKLKELVDSLTAYYMEIQSDCTDNEKNVWNDILTAQRFIQSQARTKRWKIVKLNEIDQKLRVLAKKHGFLTKNMKDGSSALVN